MDTQTSGNPASSASVSILFLVAVTLASLLWPARPLYAATLKQALLPNIEASTFEVVAAKPTHHRLTYAKPLPMNLIPYQERVDKFHQIGTAFAIGHNRYVTAAHVFLTGLNSLWGPPSLRSANGHVYAIAQIEKFARRRDFVVFSLKSPPKTATILPLNTHPTLNQTVYTVGNALGKGIVIRSGLYTSNTPENQSGAWNWLQYSAAASPGNSGGPLLDQKGQVIGVVLGGVPGQNFNYALPISEVVGAPANMARINEQSQYGFPLIQDQITATFKTNFKLPISQTRFYSEYTALRNAFVDHQLKAVLAKNAETMFPHGTGSARLLYGAPQLDSFPYLMYRAQSGDWGAFTKGGNVPLDDHGFVRFSKTKSPDHAIVFWLRRPDNVAQTSLRGHPRAFMNLLLQTGVLTRDFGPSKTDQTKIKITSLGAPTMDAAYTDAWKRPWRVMVWPMPFDNHLAMVLTLPTPDGYVGFMTFTEASDEHDYLINLEAMTSFFSTGYVGTLQDWDTFLATTGLVPPELKEIHLGTDFGHRLSYQSAALGFTVPSSVQRVTPQSMFMMVFSFSHTQHGVAWVPSLIALRPTEHDDNGQIVIMRGPNPQGDPNGKYNTDWKRALDRAPPDDGISFPNDEATNIIGVAGGAHGTNPSVLYLVRYLLDGQQPQALMQKRLEILMKGMRVKGR